MPPGRESERPIWSAETDVKIKTDGNFRVEWNHGVRYYDLPGEIMSEFGFLIDGTTKILLEDNLCGITSDAGEYWWMIVTCRNSEEAELVANKIAHRSKICTEITRRNSEQPK